MRETSRPLKVVWISASVFADNEEKQSGVWQKALALRLAQYAEVELSNISYQYKSKDVVLSEFGNIKQWGLPKVGKIKNGFPPKATCDVFRKIIAELNPDIIHIWGSENPFKLLPFEKDVPGVKVLSMQGVLHSIAENLMHGLSRTDLLSTLGIHELIKRDSLFDIKKSFEYNGMLEKQMIRSCNYIITQSEWTTSQIRPINLSAVHFRINRVLRLQFLNAENWLHFNHSTPVVYSAAVGYSLKGLHILIKALAVVKKEFPDVQLRLAGAVGRTDFLGNGYIRFIRRLIDKVGVKDNVVWLGAIPAATIVAELQNASVFVHPSFIESYSLVVAEAMAVGTPSVISRAGAMPELAMDQKEALFFTPGDYKQCAQSIIQLLSDNTYSRQISTAAIHRTAQRNTDIDTPKEQLEIYKKILDLESK